MSEPKWNPMRQAFDRPPSLAEFVLVRVDEDEADARRAMEGFTTSYWTHDGGIYAGHPTAEVVNWVYNEAWDHIARHDPARVLAECEAKRRIVSYASTLAKVADDEGRRRNGADMLRLLALPYADHPAYRPEFRP